MRIRTSRSSSGYVSLEKIKIPFEYQEVEYIETTGTQYIDTNIIPTVANETMVQGSFALNNISSGENQSIGSNNNINFYAVSNLSVFRICGYQTTIPLDTNKHAYSLQIKSTGRHIVFDNSNFKGSLPSSVGAYNFCLGCMNGGNSIYLGKYKIYETKIYNSNVLVRNLIPCYRKSDNEIGMYDLVNDVFYTNSGTGTFLKGNNVHDIIKTTPKINLLPIEYQGVEYISTNSPTGQYIDTGYIPSYTNGFDIEIKFKPSSLGQRYCLLSSYNQGNAQLSLELNVSNQFRFWANNGSTDAKIGTINNTSMNVAKASYHGNTYTITCNGSSSTGSFTTSTIPNYSTWLFLDRAKRTTTFVSSLLIYSCKIWNNNILIRNFVPCYRKSDNVIGMYDTINDVFYTNSGSGTFLKGNDKNFII